MLRTPEHTDFIGPDIFPDTMASIFVIVVLCDSVSRWGHPSRTLRMRRGWISLLAVIGGVVLALIVLPDAGMITYLVHVATQGIEHAQPFKFQRSGFFPDQRLEGFRFFWLSLIALLAVMFAAIALVASNLEGLRKKFVSVLVAAYFVLLVAAALFCVWYYTIEFHRISPDLASTGLGSNWFDFLCGAIVAAMIVTTGAYRLAKTQRPQSIATIHPGSDQLPLHERLVFLLLFVGAIIDYYVEDVLVSMQMSMFGPFSVVRFLSQTLSYTPSYIMLGIGALALQLAYLRWKRREQPIDWELQALNPTRFLWNWLALALLVIVGLPTISVYCFAFWLGPWCLY
jgi:hypothetical protein